MIGELLPPTAFTWVESTFVQSNLRPCAWARLDGQNVETARGRLEPPGANELPRHARQVAALLPIHGLLWRRAVRALLARLGSRARLNLDEFKNRPVVADHVDFAFDVLRHVVARDHRVTVTAKIPVSVRLASDAGVRCACSFAEASESGSARPFRAAKSTTAKIRRASTPNPCPLRFGASLDNLKGEFH